MILLILLISTNNIKILEPYKRLYLVLSIILWLIITLYYLLKICLLIVIIIIKKQIQLQYFEEKIIKIVKLIWYIIFGISFLFLFIGLISDIVNIIQGNIKTIKYAVAYFFVGFCYTILSFFDYIFIVPFIYIIYKKIPSLPNGILDQIQENLQNQDNSDEEEKKEEEKEDENAYPINNNGNNNNNNIDNIYNYDNIDNKIKND